MSEKSLSIEALQGIDSASEDRHHLSYDGKTRATAPNDQETLDKQSFRKLVTHLGEAPDGGSRAWLVVFAVALVSFSTFGFVNSWGVFQAYYEEDLLRHLSPSTIAWIGSIQYALVYLPALATGRLFDLGYFKIPCFVASCVIVACTFLTAECTQYWQFFLAQGLGVGVGCGIIFSPTLVIVSHWFSKRRGLALSVAAIGTSCGSTVFPVAAQNLIPLIGFKWTVRVFGFILMATLGTANILLERRLPPRNVHGGLFNLKAFRNKAYTTYCISGIMTLLGLYTVLTYLSVSAVAIGVPKDFAFYLIAIANATSVFGRLLAGLMADKVGALNVMVPYTAVSGIMSFAWPFAKNESQLIAIAAIYGFSFGGYVSLFSAPVVAMGTMEDAGRRVGMFMSLIAFGGLAGPPISGAIRTATAGFVEAGYYAGGIIIFAVVLMVLARHLHLGRLWGKF